jgi:stage V sporulation protein B
MRGPQMILMAKLVFMAAGYVLVAGLTRQLSQEAFGLYSVVFGIVAVVNMVVINGTMQTVSRHVAAHPEHAGGIRRRSFAYQAVFSGGVLAIFYLLAPAIAAFLNEPSLARPLRLTISVIGFYAFYAINVGYLNGQKRFERQAILDMMFAVLKVSLILWLAKKHGLEGAIFGFAVAAAVILLVSFPVANFDFSGPVPAAITPKRFIRFGVSVLGVALVLNLILQTDLLLLVRLTSSGTPDAEAGLYGAAQQIARIPYYLMVTAALVLFPTVAGLESKRAQRQMVTRGFTGVFGLLLGMVAITVPVTERVLRVLYPASYGVASDTLRVLIMGMAILTLLFVTVTMLSASGHPQRSAGLLGLCLAVQVASSFWLIPWLGALGAAWATTIGSGTGLVAAVVSTRRLLGLKIPLYSLGVAAVAAIAAGAVMTAFDQWMPASISPVITVLALGTSYTAYLCILAVGGTLLGVPAEPDRVLWVSKPISAPMNDGSKVLVHALARYLPPAQLAVLVARKSDPLLPQGVESIAVYGRSGSFGGRLAENLRVFGFLLLHRRRFQAVHFFFAPNPAACRPIRWLANITPGVPFFQTVMSRPKSYDRISDLLFGHAIVAHSEDTRVHLEQASKRPVLLIRPGIEAPSDCDSDAARMKLRLSYSRFYLLFAGDMEADGTSNALQKMMASVPDFDLLLSVRTKTENSRKVADGILAAFPDRVRAFYDHEPFQDLLDAQDAMIFPSANLYRKLDAPLVILETLARGIPVFMPDRAPLNEIPDPEDRPLLLAQSDADLARLLQAHMDDPTRIDAERLRRRIRETFSVQLAAKAYSVLYPIPNA